LVLIALVMAAIAIAVVTAPLRGKRRLEASAEVTSAPEPESEYRNALLAIRDLDFDRELGVVAQGDYDRLREKLVATAARTMPQEEPSPSARPPRGRAEAETGAPRGRLADSRDHGSVCPECGRPFQPGHVFCGGCGTRLSAA